MLAHSNRRPVTPLPTQAMQTVIEAFLWRVTAGACESFRAHSGATGHRLRFAPMMSLKQSSLSPPLLLYFLPFLCRFFSSSQFILFVPISFPPFLPSEASLPFPASTIIAWGFFQCVPVRSPQVLFMAFSLSNSIRFQWDPENHFTLLPGRNRMESPTLT